VTVKVELYGVVRDLVKETNTEIHLPDRDGASFGDVLEELAERHGPAFRDRLFGRQGLLSHVKVYSGGKPVEDLGQPLPADAAVVRIIVFAAAGGG
jgi:molybdopterin converting factor small subunit